MNKTIRYHIKWFYVYQIMNSGKVSVQLLNLLYLLSGDTRDTVMCMIMREFRSYANATGQFVSMDSMPCYVLRIDNIYNKLRKVFPYGL